MATSTLTLDPRFAVRTRQPGLDLLRALAIVLVICYHGGNFGFTLPHDLQRFGWIGVDLFFVLSGYLIGGQLLAPLAQGGQPDLTPFFWRRALRILPAYLVVLAVYTALPSWREWPQMPPTWEFAAFVQNIGLHGGTAFSHAWSLCVEAQFYLVLPFLLLWVAQKRHAGIVAAGGVIFVGIALRAVIAYAHPAADGNGVSGRAFQTLVYYPTWTRLDPLVLGVGLAATERFRPRWWAHLLGHARWLWLPGLVAIGYGLFLGEGDMLTVAACIWQFPLIALGMSLLLICAVSERLPFHRLRIPGAAFVASVAYSVYLSHKLVIHQSVLFCAARHLPLTSATAIVLNFAAILVGGSLLYFAVERPFLLLRRRSAVRALPRDSPVPEPSA